MRYGHMISVLLSSIIMLCGGSEVLSIQFSIELNATVPELLDAKAEWVNTTLQDMQQQAFVINDNNGNIITLQPAAAAAESASPIGFASVRLCAVGYYYDGNECQVCSGTCGSQLTVETCSAGGDITCGVVCPAGTWTSVENGGECRRCDPGTYSSESGQSVCLLCPAGSYARNAQQTTCQVCAVGTYSNAGSSLCSQVCPFFLGSMQTQHYINGGKGLGFT